MKRLLSCCLLLSLVLPSLSYAGARDDALRAFKVGMALIDGGDFLAGAEELERAYQLSPHPSVLYNIGLAYAEAGELDRAIGNFVSYLESDPVDRGEVERLMYLLEQRRQELAEGQARVLAERVGVEGPDQLEQLVARLEGALERLSHVDPGPVPLTDDVINPQALEAKEGEIYEDVVVSASRQVTTPANAPAGITLIGADEIRLSGATNLPDLLRRVPGMSILTMGSGNANLAIRGFNQRISNKILTLVDGRSVYLDFLGGTFFRLLDVDLKDIERIEIIRGPGSTLYGASAFGGVVNIITKGPGANRGGLVHLTGGSGGVLLGNVQFSGRKGVIGYRASVGYEQSNRFELELGERADFVVNTKDVELANRGLRANAGLRILPEKGLSIGFSGGINSFYDNFHAIGLLKDFWMGGVTGHLRADLGIRGFRARVFWNHFRADAAPTWLPVGGANFGTTTQSNVIDVEASYSTSLSLGVRHDLSAGAGYRIKTIDWDYLDGSHLEHHLSGFVEDRITFLPQLVAVLGFRFDQHPLVGFTPSPRGALLIKPTSGQALRLSLGTAFRNPTFLESYLNLTIPTEVTSGVGIRSLGSATLRPENIFSVELGYVYEDSDFISFEVAGYYQRIADLIALGSVVPAEELNPPDSGVFIAGASTFENAEGSFHGGGAEVGVHAFPIDGLDVRANYSFSYMVDQRLAELGEEDAQDRRHPTHMGNIGASFRSRFGLDVNVDVHLVSSVFVPERSFDSAGNVVIEDCPGEAYAMVSARLGYRLFKDQLELALTAHNLPAWGDGGHREHCMGTRVGPRLLGSAVYRF
ncbi:MAG: hypothetical protein CMP23_01415 [Rickettsiales bacterium]|nr:hypothetical protein [Rickettsiales bacterium]|tara:strand:+ start:2532 stop:4976 length:2445 start_codon:yes stop_codon:yes gene_type:complete